VLHGQVRLGLVHGQCQWTLLGENMADDLLAEGIAALRAGRKVEARNLLTQVVEQDDRNEMAWLWLSGAVDTDEERRICLENVLAVNPQNAVARRGLDSLIAKEGVQPLKSVSPPTPRVERAATPPEQPAQPSIETRTPDVPERKKVIEQQTRWMIGLGAGALVIACIGFVGIWWAFDSGLLQLGPTAPVAVGTTQELAVADAASTRVASPTQLPRRAADYTLHTSDMPSYFVPGAAGPRYGDWHDGYYTIFTNTILENMDPDEALRFVLAQSGDTVLSVISNVYVFETTDKADGQVSGLVETLARVYTDVVEPAGGVSRQVSVASFADEVSARDTTIPAEDLSAHMYLYGFRRDSVVVVLTVMGFGRMGGIDEACHYYASTILTKIDRDTR